MKHKIIKTIILSVLFSSSLMYDVYAAKHDVKLWGSLFGDCSITAYSGNNGSTFGTSLRTLEPRISCAACECIPLDSWLYVEDYGMVRVDDRIGEDYACEMGHMVLDLYLDDYDAACEWGRRDRKVWVLSKIDIDGQEKDLRVT